MKREHFITLILSVAGTLLLGLGMCMCLLPEWNAFREGVVLGVAGLAVPLSMLLIRRKMLSKKPIRLSRKTAGTILLAALGALSLGVGMCMCMVWEGMMVRGVLVGILGILLLLCLIPFCRGLT